MDPSASTASGSPCTRADRAAAAPGPHVLVPANVKNAFGDWEKELLARSMVNIHSKVIVLDPFGEKPRVMTGSHNLGFKASSENDDKPGRRRRQRAAGPSPMRSTSSPSSRPTAGTGYVEAHRQDPKVWHGLVDNDQWQASHLAGDQLAELEFWLGADEEGPTTQLAPAAPGKAVRRRQQELPGPARAPSRPGPLELRATPP